MSQVESHVESRREPRVAAPAGPPVTPPTVSVVVCAYTEERWDDLLAGHDALLHQTATPDEVVVVIDHNPALLDRARAALPGTRVLPNTGERGLSGARNTGVAACRGELVLFLDDDACPRPDWVERFRAVLAAPDVVGVGGWAVPRWDAPGRPGWFPESFLWVVGCSYDGLPRVAADIRNPIGCTMGFRTAAVRDASGFTTGIGRVGRHPVGCEETELSIRLRHNGSGSRIRHEPDAVVDHRVPAARLGLDYFVRRCFWEGFSKAVVASSVGARDALASERSYAVRTLPTAVARGIGRFLRHRDTAAALQSGAVVLGLATTVLGYGYGRAHRPRTTSLPAAVVVAEHVR